MANDFQLVHVITFVLSQMEREIYNHLRQILSGEESIKLYLDFLKRNNKVDMLILKATKVLCFYLMISSSSSLFSGLFGSPFICLSHSFDASECLHAFWYGI